MCCPTCSPLRHLFAGFFAIVQAMQGDFERAAMAIFIAMVLDGLDGRVARMTNTQSAFGAEYDSLSDMVSFGAAPALVMYEWALRDLGRLGWIAAFIYCAGAALRLARFNTTLEVMDKRYFQGLPSPAAAALVAGLVWVMIVSGVAGSDIRWLACVLDHLCRRDDGFQYPLLQFQGYQPAQERAVLCDCRDCAWLCAGCLQS
jgi:CDP-diacylglycerol--serine O-phosphatidyltransferase